MKRLPLTAVFLLASTFLWAQGRRADIFNDYDLDSAAYVFCDTTDVPAIMGACATGIAATDGWIDVSGDVDKVVGIAIDTLGVVGGLDVQFQVRYAKEDGTFTSTIVLMTLINKTTATTDNQSVRLPDEVSQFRVGIKIGTADDGGDAIVEDIDVIYNGR